MLIWRGLSPKAILDCIDYLLPHARKTGPAETLQGTAVATAARRETERPMDRATMEIESRL